MILRVPKQKKSGGILLQRHFETVCSRSRHRRLSAREVKTRETNSKTQTHRQRAREGERERGGERGTERGGEKKEKALIDV